jgi:hypothetical protein
MFSKIEILLIIIGLLLVFHFVISWGAKVEKKSPAYNEIKKYLFGVRVLIIVIALVSLILWLIL